MSLHRIASRLYLEPWNIMPERHLGMHQQFQNYVKGDRKNGPVIHVNRVSDPEEEEYKSRVNQQADMDCLSCLEISHGIAIVPVFGILGKHLSMLDTFCGGYDYETLVNQALALQNRSDVHTVIMHFNTPGGAVQGCEDSADVLVDLAASKRLISYADMAASAGYFQACAAGEIYCGKSAVIGSVGTMCAMLDESEAYKMEGLRMDLFTSGTLKGAGTEGTSLTPAQRTEIQSRVDSAGASFRSFVKSKRPSVTDDSLQGQWFYGQDALDRGLVDAIAPTLQHVIAMALQ